MLHPIYFLRKINIRFSILRIFFNILATDYLVFGQNLIYHYYFVGARDATQPVAHIYWFISKDTFIIK